MPLMRLFWRPMLSGPERAHALSQSAQRREAENIGDRERRHPTDCANFAVRLHSQQRMPPQIKECVIARARSHAKHLAPDLGNFSGDLIRLRCGRGMGHGLRHPGALKRRWGRQRLAVEFLVGCEREGLKPDDVLRHHKGRQRALQSGAQRGFVERRV